MEDLVGVVEAFEMPEKHGGLIVRARRDPPKRPILYETQPGMKQAADPSQYISPQAGSSSLRPATYGCSRESFVF